MKRILIVTTLMLVVFSGLQAQTLSAVLEKNYEATGLKELSKVKTFSQKIKMSMMGMEMPMEIKVKKPNKFRVEVDMMGQKTISAFDGEKGWMINPMMGAGVQDLQGEQLEQAMSQADMEGELYNYEAKGFTAELIGKVNSDGKEAFKVKLTDKEGNVRNYFIDANTYLVSKMKTKVEAMGQSVDIETKIMEYEKVDGVQMAKKMEIVMPMGTQKMEVEEIKFNEKLDDSIFARPAN